MEEYQIDNTDAITVTIEPNGNGNTGETFNDLIMKRFLYGDQADSHKTESLSDTVGESKEYEIVTFKQSNNSSTLDTTQDTKCIYSLILQKKQAGTASSDNYKGMWLCIFCPKKACSSTGCGNFSIWKINTISMPNTKLSWFKTGSGTTPKYSITTTFTDTSGTTVGDKVIIGIVGSKFYLSPKSFYLEGRHEDILKKMPSLNGVNITILSKNISVLV